MGSENLYSADSTEPGRENGVPEQARARRLKPSHAATAIVLLVLLGMALTFFLPHRQAVPLDQNFTAEHVEMLGMSDNAAQRLAYRVGIVLLVMLTLGAMVVVTWRTRFWATATARRVGTILTGVKNHSGLLIFAAYAVVFLLTLQQTAFAVPNGRKWRLGAALVSLSVVLGAMRMGKRLTMRFVVVAAWLGVGAYGLFLIVPGLVRPLIVLESRLSSVEWHYSVTLAQADRLAAGLSLGTEINLNYGLLHQVALAIFERGFGLLDFGGHIRLVQLTQVAFLLAAIFAFWLWKPRRPLFILFATALIGAWLSTSHIAIYYPNQAGWRSLAFPVGIAFLLLMKRQTTRRAALLLGGMATASMLYNPETGLCLAAGYGLFLMSRLGSLRPANIVAHALRAALGATLMVVAVLLLYRGGLGAWPPLNLAAFAGFITRFGQGYGGLPLYFDPLATIMFAHGAYIVVFTLLRWRRGDDLNFADSVKLALSATILVWFTYYINRPHPWNLWTFKFLYVFLIADFFEPRFLRHLWLRGARAFAGARLATVTFILLPMIISTNHYILTTTRHPPTLPADNQSLVSGLLMTKTSAEALRAKAEFLARQDFSDTLYITRHSYSLALMTGSFIRLPVQDVFAETISREDFERRLAEIERIAPRVILIDAPGDRDVLQDPGISYYTRFFARLHERLAARYELREVTHGWQVWELRGV